MILVGGVLIWTNFGPLKAGIVSSFELSLPSGEKKEQTLWIHHFVILQLFHPNFRHHPEEKTVFKHDNHNLFVGRITPSEHQNYLENYGYTAPYAWKWLGAGRKILFVGGLVYLDV